MARTETHEVLSRYAARDVLREAALLLLDGAPLNSERFKEIITKLKEQHPNALFIAHPERDVGAAEGRDAGRPGDGSLDRVILLLDEAAPLPFAVPVKYARARILEFCTALD